MNLATLIYIVLMLGLCGLFYFFGSKGSRNINHKDYKRDIDEYLKKRDAIDRIDRDKYSKSDVLSGKVLEDNKDT